MCLYGVSVCVWRVVRRGLFVSMSHAICGCVYVSCVVLRCALRVCSAV